MLPAEPVSLDPKVTAAPATISDEVLDELARISY